MKLSLLICLMFCTTALGGGLPKLWLYLFRKWIPKATDVDVMMLLDSSASVGQTNFNKGKKGIQFVNEMIDFRTPSGITGQPNGSRLGYIQFSSPNKTSIRIHLPEFDDVFYLNDEIQSQAYDHGMSTAMAMALKLACYECSIKNPNPGSEKRLLLVTDGFDTVGGNVTIVADSMKAKGAEICVAAIGTKIDLPALKTIATKYPMDHKMIPCVLRAKTWLRFKKGMRKAARLLEKGKREGEAN